MTSIGQFRSLTWGHLGSRSRGGSDRSCCISTDAPWRDKHCGAIPMSVSLFNQKLLTKRRKYGAMCPLERSSEVTRVVFGNNFWLDWDTDTGFVSLSLFRQGASADTQHDLHELTHDLDLRWPQVKLRNWPIEVIKYMFRTGSTSEAHWC